MFFSLEFSPSDFADSFAAIRNIGGHRLSAVAGPEAGEPEPLGAGSRARQCAAPKSSGHDAVQQILLSEQRRNARGSFDVTNPLLPNRQLLNVGWRALLEVDIVAMKKRCTEAVRE